jgi:hypothetical protein
MSLISVTTPEDLQSSLYSLQEFDREPPRVRSKFNVSFDSATTITFSNFRWTLSSNDSGLNINGGINVGQDAMAMPIIEYTNNATDFSFDIEQNIGNGNQLYGFDPNQNMIEFRRPEFHPLFPENTQIVSGHVYNITFSFDITTTNGTTSYSEDYILNISEPPPPPPLVNIQSLSVKKNATDVEFNKEFQQSGEGPIEVYASQTRESGEYNIENMELQLIGNQYDMTNLHLFLFKRTIHGPEELTYTTISKTSTTIVVSFNVNVTDEEINQHQEETDIIYILSEDESQDGRQDFKILQIGGGLDPIPDEPVVKEEKTANTIITEISNAGHIQITEQELTNILNTQITDDVVVLDDLQHESPQLFRTVLNQLFVRNVGKKQMKVSATSIPISGMDPNQSLLRTKTNALVVKTNDEKVVFSDIITEANKSDSALYCPLNELGDTLEIEIASSDYKIRKIGEGTYSIEQGGVEVLKGEGEQLVLNGYIMEFGSVTIVQDDNAEDENNGNNQQQQQQPSGNVPCFLEGTMILTSRGYKNVESLSSKDKLLNDKGQMIQCIEVKSFVQKYDGKTFPYVVPEGALMNNGSKCQMDLYLSPMHCIYNSRTNKFIPVCVSGLPQDKCVVKSYKYYHVITPNYFTDVIIANGIPCESYSEQTLKYISKQKTPKLLLKSLLDACHANPETFERKRLSAKEFKEILKKNNKTLVMRI